MSQGQNGSIQLIDLTLGADNPISDEAGNKVELVNIIPPEYQNLPNITVDTILPTISSVATVSSSTLFGPNATVDFSGHF